MDEELDVGSEEPGKLIEISPTEGFVEGPERFVELAAWRGGGHGWRVLTVRAPGNGAEWQNDGSSLN